MLQTPKVAEIHSFMYLLKSDTGPPKKRVLKVIFIQFQNGRHINLYQIVDLCSCDPTTLKTGRDTWFCELLNSDTDPSKISACIVVVVVAVAVFFLVLFHYDHDTNFKVKGGTLW